MTSNVAAAFVGVVGFEAFLGLDALHGDWVLVLDVEEHPVLILHVGLPCLEPLEANDVADVFTLLFVVDLIPFMEVLHQLLLHLFFLEDVEQPPKLAKVEVLWRPLQPVLQV